MSERQNLFAYTEVNSDKPFCGYVSLNRESSGNITLCVRSPSNDGKEQGTLVISEVVAQGLVDALRYQVLGEGG